jgi:hypothetical protein
VRSLSPPFLLSLFSIFVSLSLSLLFLLFLTSDLCV